MTRYFMAAAGFALCLLSVGFAPPAAGQSVPLPLQERMDSTAFHAAGLNKLTPEELTRLNAWLRQHTARAGADTDHQPPSEPAPATGFRHKAERTAITAHVTGQLHGWGGKTVFRLDNGQVWQQRGSDSWSAGKVMENPEVVIQPAAFGSWLLKIDGYNASTRVERIQ